MIDFKHGFPAQVSSRLQGNHVIWLTTVDAANQPQPRPVWFHWDGATILVFSQEQAAKVRQIAHNPLVALNLNSDVHGDEVTVLLGRAKILEGWPKGLRATQFIEKYREGLRALDYTPESFMAEYNIPIEIRPEAVRGF